MKSVLQIEFHFLKILEIIIFLIIFYFLHQEIKVILKLYLNYFFLLLEILFFIYHKIIVLISNGVLQKSSWFCVTIFEIYLHCVADLLTFSIQVYLLF